MQRWCVITLPKPVMKCEDTLTPEATDVNQRPEHEIRSAWGDSAGMRPQLLMGFKTHETGRVAKGDLFPWEAHVPCKIAHQLSFYVLLMLGHTKWYLGSLWPFTGWRSPIYRFPQIGDLPSMSTNSIIPFHNHDPILVPWCRLGTSQVCLPTP